MSSCCWLQTSLATRADNSTSVLLCSLQHTHIHAGSHDLCETNSLWPSLHHCNRSTEQIRAILGYWRNNLQWRTLWLSFLSLPSIQAHLSLQKELCKQLVLLKTVRISNLLHFKGPAARTYSKQTHSSHSLTQHTRWPMQLSTCLLNVHFLWQLMVPVSAS